MTSEPRLTLQIEGELTAETNGVTTTVVGSGSLVTWDLVASTRIVESGGLPSRQQLRRLAKRLRRLGVTVAITEAHRPLVDLGCVRSPMGAALFGASSVRPRSLWRLGRLARRARGSETHSG